MVNLLLMAIGFIVGFGAAAHVGAGIIQDLQDEIDELRDEDRELAAVSPRPASAARGEDDRPAA